MKRSLHLFFTSVFLFFCTTIGHAQEKATTKTSNGLTTVTFETPNGPVTVNLPDNLHAGDIISGTVITEPKGKNEKQKAKNKNVLNGYVVEFADKKESPTKKKLKWKIPEKFIKNILPLVLKDIKGNSIAEIPLPINPEPRSFVPKNILGEPDFNIPPYISAGEPGLITGPFDGDFSNSQLEINDTKVDVLAESPEGLFFDVPENLSGSVDIELTEGDYTTTETANVLQFGISADKLKLLKGESTTIRFTISGLENLDTSIPLKYDNMSPAVITMEGGNHHELMIDPKTDAPEGTFTHTVTVRAIVNGEFGVSGYIPPAQEIEKAEKEEPVLCDCRIQGRSYLLSPEACKQLQKEMHEQQPEFPDMPQEEESEPFDLFFEEMPLQHPVGEAMSLQVSPDNGLSEVVATVFSCKPALDTIWQHITTDQDGSDGWKTEFTPHALHEGLYAIKAEAVNQQNTTATTTLYTQIGNLSIADAPTDVVYNVSEADIRRTQNQARNARRGITNEETRLRELRRRLREQSQQGRENSGLASELEDIDEVLDRVPDTYKDDLKALIDSLQRVREHLPAETDSAALHAAVDEAQARLDACKERLKQLKNEQENLKNQRDEQKAQQDDLLAQLHELMISHGYTGRYGYHENGRCWWGYIGDERSAELSGVSDITWPLRRLRRSYTNILHQLEQLTPEIAVAQAECDELEEALQQAKEAAKRRNQHAAAQLAINDICRQIRSLLQPLQNWCTAHPSVCRFGHQIRNLIDECPQDSIAWQRFWQNFDNLISGKQQLEERYRDSADDNRDNADRLREEIEEAEQRIDDLEQEETRRTEEAEALRRQREHEQEEAREEARRAREERERERNRVVPQPYLDEEIDPDDDQLRFQAQRLFRELYRDYLTTEGPCDCKTKALALANNTNTIVSDIIGGIGVTVAFAPLEAFPGVSLAGRLGIGAAKALASSLYGGASLSNELVKNLFGTIGGEIFPRLVGDQFIGNKLNELAGKGLDALLEEEGVRAIEWEGETETRHCGRISGKTTLLFNPHTGWVVIMIKIPRCPLIVIKYRVNDDGVPISRPIVREIR